MKINQLVCFLLFFACTACAPATPSKEDLNNQLENTIASENELWIKTNIDNYRIKVHQSGVWVNYDMTITVKDNEVTDFEASCGEAILDSDSTFCKKVIADISPDTNTIQGLFNELKKSRMNFEADKDVTSSWSDSISITFDSQYHYPKLIRFDIPEMADEECTTEILTFEILRK